MISTRTWRLCVLQFPDSDPSLKVDNVGMLSLGHVPQQKWHNENERAMLANLRGLIKQKDNLPIPLAQTEPHLASERFPHHRFGWSLPVSQVPCRLNKNVWRLREVSAQWLGEKKTTLKSVKFHWLLFNSNTPTPKYQNLETALKPGLNTKHSLTHKRTHKSWGGSYSEHQTLPRRLVMGMGYSLMTRAILALC